MPRVVIIGSGPAGIYAADALAQQDGWTIDVIDRLPCPYGLVRYGVAPDHLKIKSIITALRKVLEQPAVRFLGNIEVGTDVSLAELHRHYDVILFANGAAVDRLLGIPGEDLPGSASAREFVAWYSGHPDAELGRFTLEARSVAVVGVGNVAVDVARILAKTPEELRATDLPDHVLDVLERSQVQDIHMLGRRGPAQAKFTTKELRELGELANADVIVHPDELQLDEASEAAIAASPAVRRNVEALQVWSQREPEGRPRRLHLRFLLRPAAVLGTDRVAGVRLERSRLDGKANAVGTGEYAEIGAQLLLRAVGYRGLPLPGLPFDERTGVVPNSGGRVLRDGAEVPGEYVAGWIKRGPTGVIGTNKGDARETVAAIIEDAAGLPLAPDRDPDGLPRLLAARGVEVVTWAGWQAIDNAELDLGRSQGRDRVKIADRAELLRAAARN
ncbi:MAG: FAD-dependent oxidoreductase [Actinomycetota bacterium]|nr:FAD-dependent oxidoreductase [Actinomycetota bacterium]